MPVGNSFRWSQVLLNEGETLTVLPGVWHCFYSEKGCIFEEVSTTHFNEDSIYKDKSIQKLKRNEEKLLLIIGEDFKLIE